MTGKAQSTGRVWSNKKIIKFINEVHMRPELWNVSFCGYRDRKAKFNAWSAVAAQFNITPDVAYNKFRNLRTYAKTEHKKKGGKSISWFAYDAISFILTDKDGESIANSSINERDEDDHESPISEESSDSSVDIPQSKISLKNEIRSQIPEPIEKIHIPESSGRNPNTSFGEYVANKLNTYDNVTRAQAEFKISKILFDADMGLFRAPEGQFQPQFSTIYPSYSEQTAIPNNNDLKRQCSFIQPQNTLQGTSSNDNRS